MNITECQDQEDIVVMVEEIGDMVEDVLTELEGLKKEYAEQSIKWQSANKQVITSLSHIQDLLYMSLSPPMLTRGQGMVNESETSLEQETSKSKSTSILLQEISQLSESLSSGQENYHSETQSILSTTPISPTLDW